MKKLKDFVFCDGVLTSSTVFYLVKVGISKKDRLANAYVAKLARSPDFFFCDHTRATMAFMEKCAQAIFHRPCDPLAVSLLRRQVIEISWLASFLRKNPPSLLNSSKFSAAENKVKVSSTLPANVKNLSKHDIDKQKRRAHKCSS